MITQVLEKVHKAAFQTAYKDKQECLTLQYRVMMMRARMSLSTMRGPRKVMSLKSFVARHCAHIPQPCSGPATLVY